MRQRIALGGVAAAAVLGLLLLWGGSVAQPASAEEQMAKNIRQAKSFTARVTNEFNFPQAKGRPIISSTFYWAAPNSFRVETFEGGELVSTRILQA